MAQSLGNLAGYPVRIYNQPDILPSDSRFNYVRGGTASTAELLQFPGFSENGDSLHVTIDYGGTGSILYYYNNSGSEVWNATESEFGNCGASNNQAATAFSGMCRVGSLLYVLTSTASNFYDGEHYRLSTINASGTISQIGAGSVSSSNYGIGTMATFGADLMKPIGQSNLFVGTYRITHEINISTGALVQENLHNSYAPSYITGDGRVLGVHSYGRQGYNGSHKLEVAEKAPTATLRSQTWEAYLHRFYGVNADRNANLQYSPYGYAGTSYSNVYIGWLQMGDYCYRVDTSGTTMKVGAYHAGGWLHSRLETWHKEYLDFIGNSTNSAYT